MALAQTWSVQTPVGQMHLYFCTVCSCPVAVLEQFIETRRQDRKSFFCPNGHQMSYHESEADLLRRERERLKQQMARKDDELAAAQRVIDAERAGAAALQRQIARAKKRAANGVCPCCTRSFANMNRHMRTKHPDYIKESGKVVPLKTA